MSVQDATNAVTAAEKTVQQTGDTQSASDKLVKDAQSRFGTWGSGDEFYLAEMNQKLVKDGLLPAVTLAYLDKNFDKADIGQRDQKLTREEVAQFVKDNPNNPNGRKNNTILDREMYQNVLKYMDSNNLTSIDKTQIAQLRQNEQLKFEKDKAQDAYYNARVLLNTNDHNESILERIKSRPPGSRQFTRDDLDKFRQSQIEADPHFRDRDEGKALDWIYDHWNDPIVQKTLANGNLMSRDGFAKNLETMVSTYGLKTDGPVMIGPPAPPEITAKPHNPPANDTPVVVPPANQLGVNPANGSNALDRYPAYTHTVKDERPVIDSEHGKHDWYFSDGKGNTVALDGADKYKPDVITLGTVDKSPDGSDKVSYTAWRKDKENNRWILYDYKTPIAIADDIDFNPDKGIVTIKGKYTPIGATAPQGVM